MDNSLTRPCMICGERYHTIHINLDTGGWYFECMRCGVHATLFTIDKLGPAENPFFSGFFGKPYGRSIIEDLDELYEKWKEDTDA